MPAEENEHEKSCLPRRYAVAIMGALGLLPVVGGRKCFAMVLTHITSQSFEEESDLLFSNCTTTHNESTSANMGGDTMFRLHAVYFAGSPFLQLPGALLATHLSSTRVIGFSVLITCLATLLLPLVMRFSLGLLFLIRFLQGAVEGIQQPASIGLLSTWATEGDRTRLFGIFFTGAYFAPALASVLTGLNLCFVNWTSSLYVYGASGVVWSLVWFRLIYDSPVDHPNMSQAERSKYDANASHSSDDIKEGIKDIPWRSILTCVPVWAMFVGTFCRTFIYSMLVVQQPQYYKDAFALNAADIGIISTLPHVGLSVSCVFGGILSDKLMDLGLSRTRTRKLLYTIGNGVEGACLIALYLTSDWRAAITLISTGVAVGGLADTGYGPLPADLAPRYAGVIAGICSAGTIGAVVNSVLASYVTGRTRLLADWQKMFLISGMVHIAGVLIFNLIAKAELQPWAEYSVTRTLQSDEEKRALGFSESAGSDDGMVDADSETIRLTERCKSVDKGNELDEDDDRFRINNSRVYGSVQ